MCPRQLGVACKVADFGMSTFAGVDGQLRGRCGTVCKEDGNTQLVTRSRCFANFLHRLFRFFSLQPGYVAPEIFSAGLHGGYGNKVDIFSAGVTLYVMLCGYEPFYGETDAELIEANKQANIDFPEEEWKDVSAAARDLVQKMMHPDPAKRLYAAGALKHPWFKVHLPVSSDTALDESMSLPGSETPVDDACVIS